jgi:hypothetical protein
MPNDPHDSGPEEGSAEGRKRRVRLHPREGSEHRFRFARRWDSRRRSRRGLSLWRILVLDVFAIVLLYLLGRQILQRIAG